MTVQQQSCENRHALHRVFRLTLGSFVSGSTSDDDSHVHTNPAVMRLLHEQGLMSARFLADFYGNLPWTIFPVSSLVFNSQGTDSSQTNCMRILICR